MRRGLKLSSFPEFEPPGSVPRGLLVRARRRLWRLKAGMDRPEYLRYGWYQGLFGCAYPDRNYVIRPNGAVSPCIYWDQDPIGFYPADGVARIEAGAPLKRIRVGLRTGKPVGTCATCGERRTALYRLGGTPPPETVETGAAARAPRPLKRPGSVTEAAAPRGSRRRTLREKLPRPGHVRSRLRDLRRKKHGEDRLAPFCRAQSELVKSSALNHSHRTGVRSV